MYSRNPKAVFLCSILGELVKEDASLSDQTLTFDQLKPKIIDALNTQLRNKHLSMIFDMFDLNQTGSIDVNNLAQISYEVLDFKDQLNIKTIKEIVENCSTNKAHITKSEFIKIMTKDPQDIKLTQKRRQRRSPSLLAYKTLRINPLLSIDPL